MSRWLFNIIFLVLILFSDNKFRTAKHDISVSEATGQEIKGKGKDCVLFAQEGSLQISTNSLCSYSSYSAQSPLGGRRFFALHFCDHGRQATMAVQMVHEAEQSQCNSLWKVQLPMARLYRLQFCAPRKRSTATRLELCRLDSNGNGKYEKENKITKGQKICYAEEVQEEFRALRYASVEWRDRRGSATSFCGSAKASWRTSCRTEITTSSCCT